MATKSERIRQGVGAAGRRREQALHGGGAQGEGAARKGGPHLPGVDAAGRESVVAVGTWECVIFFFSFAHRDLIFLSYKRLSSTY